MVKILTALPMLILASCTSLIQAASLGALNLDDFTFDKIVDGSRDVLVKFDKDYPYGDEEDEFKALCKTVGPLKASLVIAEVGVQDYGDRNNEGLRERFGISRDAFPAYRLFRKGHASTDAPLVYSGAINEGALAAFLKLETGLYIGLPGNLEVFDKMAHGFLGKDTAAATALYKAAEAAQAEVGASDAESARAYVKTMARVLEKGPSFISAETNRVKKLLGGKITEKKKKLFGERLNILSSFTSKDEL